MKAASGLRSASVEAVIVRADGSRENLGEVAYWHRNPLRRWAWRIRRALRQLLNSTALDAPGRWLLQAKVTLGGGTWRGETAALAVYAAFG